MSVTVPSASAHAASVLSDASFTRSARAELFARLKQAHSSSSDVEKLAFLPTYVSDLPGVSSTSSDLRGSACVLSLDATRVTAARVGFADATFYVGRSFVADFSDGMDVGAPLPLHDNRVTATAFIEAIARTLSQLIKEERLTDITPLPVCLSSCYSLELKKANCGSFFRFEEKCPLINEDPVEGADLRNLIEVGLERRGMKVKLVGLCTAGTAALLAGAFERMNKASNKCLLALSLDSNIQMSYVDQAPQDHKLTSALVSVDYSHFDGTRIADASESFKTISTLPRMAADFMLDCLAVPTMDQIDIDKAARVCCGIYFPELTRLMLIQLLRVDAPPALYKPNSLPFKAFAAVVTDPSAGPLPPAPFTAEAIDNTSGTFTAAKEILRAIFEWNTTQSSENNSDDTEAKFHFAAKMLSFAARVVVKRAADFAAAIIGAAAVKTGRLQPALGGVTVALAGPTLDAEFFRRAMRQSLDELFGRDTEQLMQFLVLEDADLKGAAILNWQRQTAELNSANI